MPTREQMHQLWESDSEFKMGPHYEPRPPYRPSNTGGTKIGEIGFDPETKDLRILPVKQNKNKTDESS